MNILSSIETSLQKTLLPIGKGLNHPTVTICEALYPKLNWPLAKSEYWKYTKLNAIKKLALTLPKQQAEVKTQNDAFVNGVLALTDHHHKAFLYGSELENNAHFKKHFSRLSPWKTDIFAATNLLNAQNTLGIIVPKNEDVGLIELDLLSTEQGVLENPRLFLYLEPSATLSLHIRLKGIGKNSLRNLAIEGFVGQNSALEINIHQEEDTEAYTIIQSDVEVATDARACLNHFNISSHWTRANSNLYIDGGNAHAQVNGVYLPNNKQFIDHHTFMHHAKAHSSSHELFKGIVANEGSAVFNGKVLVSKDAQKTDAFQQNNNVLLDLESSINAKPELEIYADDVKCSHGCTIGQIDEESIYYLRARGIPKLKARAMVLNAFCNDVLDLISNDSVRKSVSDSIDQRLTTMH